MFQIVFLYSYQVNVNCLQMFDFKENIENEVWVVYDEYFKMEFYIKLYIIEME